MSPPLRKACRSSAKRAISNEMLFAAKGFLRTYIQDILTTLRRGQSMEPFLKQGISIESINILRSLNLEQIDNLTENYARKQLLSREQNGFNFEIHFTAMLSMLENHNDDAKLAREYLIAGASNEVMRNYFGMRAKECSLHRVELGIIRPPGRKARTTCHLLENQIIEAHDCAMKCDKCHLTALLSVHKNVGIPIDQCYQVVSEYENLAL